MSIFDGFKFWLGRMLAECGVMVGALVLLWGFLWIASKWPTKPRPERGDSAKENSK